MPQGLSVSLRTIASCLCLGGGHGLLPQRLWGPEIRSADFVINQVRAALLGEGFRTAPDEQRLEVLVAALREHSLVIVWDNFESARGIAGTAVTANLAAAARATPRLLPPRGQLPLCPGRGCPTGHEHGSLCFASGPWRVCSESAGFLLCTTAVRGPCSTQLSCGRRRGAGRRYFPTSPDRTWSQYVNRRCSSKCAWAYSLRVPRYARRQDTPGSPGSRLRRSG